MKWVELLFCVLGAISYAASITIDQDCLDLVCLDLVHYSIRMKDETASENIELHSR